MNSNQKLKKLHSQILNCKLCWEKFGFQPKPFVWGNANAKIFQISQAPSFNVHISGKPFNDISGKILVQHWYQIPFEKFYDKNLFYISSIAHCYPGKTKRNTDRKPPIRCAKLWLEKEIKLVDNQIFIIIGSVAAHYFFKNKKFNDLIFDDNLTLFGKKTFVLPHPSPANFRWFKNNPQFYDLVLPKVRKILKSLIFSH